MSLHFIIRNILIGAIAGGVALAAELAIDYFGYFFSFPLENPGMSPFMIILIFPLLEELFKYLAIRKVPAGAYPLSPGLVALLAIGTGFGLLELILTPFFRDHLSASGLLSLVGPFLIHILTAVVIGISIGFLKKIRFAPFFAVFPALLIHSTFNAWIFFLS